MRKLALMLLGVVLVLSSILPAVPVSDDRSQHNPAVTESLPAHGGGYGYDSVTATMYDHNGFAYSYLPDGIIRLTLPWGYVTYFSFGMAGSYLGVPQKVSALDYTWTWDAEVSERLNETEASLGYDYTFTATNSETLDWTIALEFSCVVGEHMKITHTVTNNYPNTLTGVEFWYLFDLTHTPEPCMTTNLGTYYPPLYSALPDSVTWLRLSNQFQFDWRDADYSNGHAYLGDGSVVGVDVDILGVSLVLGDIATGASRTIDPYFSGVTRTWNAAGASYSGIAASWSPVGVPATGDNITFDATSVQNCNWNTSVTVGDFNLNTGYSGTVTQTANFGANNITLSAGILVGSTTCIILCSGNILESTSATITDNTLRVSMISDGSSITKRVTSSFRYLAINASITWLSAGGSSVGSYGWYISADGVLIVTAGYTAVASTWATSSSFTNLGSINGPGTFRFAIQTYDISLRFGDMNGITTCVLYAPTTRSCVITQVDDAILASFSISSSHASYILSLHLGTYSLSAAGITIATGGALTPGSSFITDSGIWSSSAGTFTPGTSTVTLSGMGSTVTTGVGQSFYNLDVSGTYTTASSVNVTHDLTVSGGLTIGAGLMTTWESDGEYSNTGTIGGTGTLEISPTVDYGLTLGTVECPLLISGANTVSLATDTELSADLTMGADAVLDPNDMVITFSGDMELDLSASAGSSLWNCTVEAGVTLTLTADVTVQLRATVLGTVAGADFIEPEPAFTSAPDLTASPLEVYEYAITQAYWDALSVVEAPAWLSYLDGSLVGVPAESDVGFSNVSLLLTWNDMTTYQNFTVYVAYTPTVDMPWFTTTMSLVLSLVLGFGCLILGLVFQMHYLTFFSGLIWLFSALGVYSDINIGWTVLSIALGMMLMMFGGAKIAGE